MLDSFLDTVFRGILAAAEDRGCNLLFACGLGSQRDLDLGRPALPFLLPEADFVPVGPWNTDGLLVLPPLASESAMFYFEDLVASGFPLIFAGDRRKGPAVVVDNEGGIRQALLHLSEHGHRRIAFIAGIKHRVQGDSGIRLEAYQTAMNEWGLEYHPDLIAIGHHTYEGGRQAMREILDRKVKFTAVLGSNDESAVGAIDVLREAGIRVPQDIAVIGFDNRIEAKAEVPMLTTVNFPMVDLGFEAVELLIKCIEGEASRDVILQIPTRLVIRESCGCLPGASSATKHGQFVESEMRKAISAVTHNEMQRLSFFEADNLCQRLVDNFKISLTRGIPLTFLNTLQQILEYTSSLGDDLYAWQEAISILRESTPDLLDTLSTPLSSTQVEDMLHQARMAIGEVTRGQSSQLSVYQTEVADRLGQMTAQFFAAQNETGIMEGLSRSVPSVGIQHAHVAFFEPEGEDPVSWSILQTSLPPKVQTKRFPSRRFPPQGLYKSDEPYRVILMPLKIQDSGPSGFVALDASNIHPSATIVRQVTAALRDVQLHREAVEGRKLAEEGKHMAEEANKLKSRFLSMVSHELRTPLNLIFGLSDILLRESEFLNPAECIVDRNDLERIHIAAQHLDSLISDVLDLARSDVGQLNLVLKPLDLRELLRETSVIGEQLARDKELSWQVQIPDNLPAVQGDPTRLRQVILNLITNAVKFTARGGVSLSAEAEDGSVKISVSDTGLGIPPTEQEIIFDEFRQSERSTARGFGGLGLGLAICKRIVEMHGGKIAIHSSGDEGEGSTFFFTLPTADIQPFQPSINLASDLVKKVALLVKDEKGGQILKNYLAHQGFDVYVRQACNDGDWLAWLLISPPDAIVIDLGLTSESGWQLLKILKEYPAFQDIPVLFYSLQDEEDKGYLLELDYLTKPVGTTELAQALVSQGVLEGLGDKDEKTILIVDDDPEILELHARIIAAQLPGYQLQLAHNGKEALEYIHHLQPSLVLLDLIMPEVDGFEVLERMRKEEATRTTPVIVLTGQTLTGEDMARLNRGVASVLEKGLFRVDETLEHISTTLARKRKPGSEAQRSALKAMAYIHTHYADPISRQDIATHVGLSERHLTRCFTQEVGMTPITYLNRFRVKQARQLLEEGNQSISVIATKVGFSTSGYFTRVFREEVGESPREYKRTKSSGV